MGSRLMVVSIERDGAAKRAGRWSAASPVGAWRSFPADGLYGLACDPSNAAAIERIHAIKGRDDGKPSAVMFFSPLAMRELISDGGAAHPGGDRRRCCPGPVTLVVDNPRPRIRWPAARIPSGSGSG